MPFLKLAILTVLCLTFSPTYGVEAGFTPLLKEEAATLLTPIRKALDEYKARENEKVTLPGKVEERVASIEIVERQIRHFQKTGQAPKGILTWFKEQAALTKEDGKYIAGITELCALYVEQLLRFHRAENTDKELAFLNDLSTAAGLFGNQHSDDQLKEIAASIRMMESFEAKAKKQDQKKLSKLGILVAERCEVIAGIANDPEEKALKDMSTIGKYLRTTRCLLNLDPVFDAIQRKGALVEDEGIREDNEQKNL